MAHSGNGEETDGGSPPWNMPNIELYRRGQQGQGAAGRGRNVWSVMDIDRRPNPTMQRL